MTPLLLTVDEVAELLRTTRGAIYVMVARGQLAGVTRIGRRVLFRSEDVLRRLDRSAPSHIAPPSRPDTRRPRK